MMWLMFKLSIVKVQLKTSTVLSPRCELDLGYNGLCSGSGQMHYVEPVKSCEWFDGVFPYQCIYIKNKFGRKKHRFKEKDVK